MIILDNNGNPVGRGSVNMPLAAGWSYADETPELLERLPMAVDAGVSSEVAAVRLVYLDGTAKLCVLAGVPYIGKLERARIYELAQASNDKGAAALVALGIYDSMEQLRRLEGESWWDNITGV